MLVQIPPNTPNRIIVKYELADYVTVNASFAPTRKAFWSGLGWISTAIEIPTMTSLPSASVHVEFQAPVGIDLETSILVSTVASLERRSRRRASDELPSEEVKRLFKALHTPAAPVGFAAVDKWACDSEVGRHSDLSHVYLPNIRATNSLRAFVVMKPEPTSQLWSGVLGAFLLVSFLWLGAARPETFLKGPDTLLLTVPTALVGILLVKQHQVVSRLSSTLRFVLCLTVALAALAVGLTLATDMADTLRNGFKWLRWPATLIAALIVPSVLGTRRSRLTTEKDSEPPQ